jgi:hypothetical protein
MIKHGLLAAGLVLAASVPALAQMPPPPPGSSTTVILPGPGPASPPPGMVTPSSTTTTIVIAPNAPPAPKTEDMPPPPSGPHMVWQPGHWDWNRGDTKYVWLSGEYAAPPTVAASWTPGHWEQRPDGWIWIDGHW